MQNEVYGLEFLMKTSLTWGYTPVHLQPGRDSTLELILRFAGTENRLKAKQNNKYNLKSEKKGDVMKVNGKTEEN